MGMAFLLFLLLPFFHLIRSPFDSAELENLQASWLVHQGLVPYRDFFEHHSPLFFYLASLQFYLAQVESDPVAAIRLIFTDRTAFWVLSLATVACTGILGLLWRDKKTAIFSSVFLLSTAMFFRSGTEIHPEALAGFLWVCTCLALFLAQGKGERGRSHPVWTLLAGLLYGMVVLTTQEMLWMFPWLILLLVAPMFMERRHIDLKKIIGQAIFFVLGCGSIFLLSFVYFSAEHTLDAFLAQFINEYNYPISPFRNLLYLLVQQPALILFPVIALISLTKGWISHKQIDPSLRFFIILTVGMTISLLLFPAPHQQYFVFILPLLSLVASATLPWIARNGSDSLVAWRLHVQPDTLEKAICLVTLFPGLLISGYMQVTLPRSPQPQLEVISYVIQNTEPQDMILDGRTGAFLFRPIAWYYWIQHTQVREIIPPEVVDQLIQNLEDGTISPRLVNLDSNLQRVSPDLTEYLSSNYQAIGIGDLREKIQE